MDAERWRRIEDLFFEALDREESARPAFLEAACNGDGALRSEVDRMLEAEEKAGARLAGAVGGAVRSLAETVPAGSVIGPYQILQPIGEGGMGMVYRARRSDDVFKKDVAIKVVKRGMDTDAILRRFRHERRILASLEHPYIARVLDGGSTESGLPYLVMEYVDGQPVTAHANQHTLGLHERLRLFQKICDAVEYAHRNLIVHRDLKPSNILVDDTQGNPRLLDFGIAKILDETDGSLLLTTINQRLFTPAYASPEQVKGEPVTVATDVYCLGLVLYELLTGSPAQALDAATPAAALKAVCEDEVRPPSQAARLARSSGKPVPVPPERLSGDLDRIVLMALEKAPRQRYGSVELLSSDLRNYLASRPVLARPQTARYRAAKFARRHRGALVAAAVIVSSLVGGIAYSTFQARRAEARFQQVRKLANTFVFDVHDAIQPLAGSTKARQLLVSTGLEYLDSLAKEAAGDPELQLELAQAYAKLGNVQGAGRVGTHLGDTVGALASHRKALDLLEALGGGHAVDLKVRRDLAASYKAVGDLELDAGNRSLALIAYRRSLEISDQIVTHSERTPRDTLLHGQALVRIGEQQAAEGNRVAAFASFQKALDEFRSYGQMSAPEEGQSPVAYGLQSLAKAYGGYGEVELAVRTYREAVKLRKAVFEQNPESPRSRRELAVVCYLLGSQLFSPFEFSAEDRKEALGFFSKALEMFKEVKAADPSNVRSLLDLGLTLAGYSRAVSPDDPLRALEMAEQAENISRQMAETDAANWDAQRNWANTFHNLAGRFSDLRRWSDAARAAERSLRMMKQVAEKLPEGRRDLVRDYRQAGDIRTAMHDFGGLDGAPGRAVHVLNRHRTRAATTALLRQRGFGASKNGQHNGVRCNLRTHGSDTSTHLLVHVLFSF